MSNVHSLMIDKSFSISNAFTETGITTLCCYFHAKKNMKDKCLNSYWKSTAEAHINMLHLCRSREEFNCLLTTFSLKWIQDGQDGFAQYVSRQYGSGCWQNWFIGALPAPGIGMTNNSTESFNKVIKQYITSSVSMGSFFDKAMVSVLEHVTRKRKENSSMLQCVFLQSFCQHPSFTKAVKRIVIDFRTYH